MRFKFVLTAFGLIFCSFPLSASLLTTATVFRDVVPPLHPGDSVCQPGSSVGTSMAAYNMPYCDASSGHLINESLDVVGHALGKAGYGSLGTFVQATGEADLDSTGTAQFSDTITLSGIGAAFLEFDFQVGLGCGSYGITADCGTEASLLEFNGSGFDLASHWESDNQLGTYTANVTFTSGPILLGTPFFFSGALSSSQWHTNWNYDGFWSSATLDSIRVLDANGGLMKGISYESGSGSAYPLAGVVPEPSTVLLGLTGFVAIAMLRIRSRRRLRIRDNE